MKSNVPLAASWIWPGAPPKSPAVFKNRDVRITQFEESATALM
jgi:hypothetical protein